MLSQGLSTEERWRTEQGEDICQIQSVVGTPQWVESFFLPSPAPPHQHQGFPNSMGSSLWGPREDMHLQMWRRGESIEPSFWAQLKDGTYWGLQSPEGIWPQLWNPQPGGVICNSHIDLKWQRSIMEALWNRCTIFLTKPINFNTMPGIFYSGSIIHPE